MKLPQWLHVDRKLCLLTDVFGITVGYTVSAFVFSIPYAGILSYAVYLSSTLLILQMLDANDDVSSYKVQRKRLPLMLGVATFLSVIICGLTDLVLCLSDIYVPSVPESVVFFLLSYFTMLFGRLILNELLITRRARRSVLILYSNECPESFLDKLTVSLCDYASVEKLPIGETEELEIVGHAIDRCQSLLIIGNASNAVRDTYILHALGAGKQVQVIPTVKALSFMHAKIGHIGDTPVIRMKQIQVNPLERAVKRAFDFCAALAGLVLLSPIFLICAVMIKLDSKGPVFYLQERYTRGMQRFKIVKFRTMVRDAEKDGARLAVENDSRITKVGKILRACRLDELPQLWNILKGEMSIVGPRPERPVYADEYIKMVKNYKIRYSVKAGLTGYAQIHGKYNTKVSDKVLLDMLYISEFSLWLDLKLMVQTIYIMFLKESTEGVEEDMARVPSKKSS